MRMYVRPYCLYVVSPLYTLSFLLSDGFFLAMNWLGLCHMFRELFLEVIWRGPARRILWKSCGRLLNGLTHLASVRLDQHWPKLRKSNGERYAYLSHRQAVLESLRSRPAWAHLVERPKVRFCGTLAVVLTILRSQEWSGVITLISLSLLLVLWVWASFASHKYFLYAESSFANLLQDFVMTGLANIHSTEKKTERVQNAVWLWVWSSS